MNTRGEPGKIAGAKPKIRTFVSLLRNILTHLSLLSDPIGPTYYPISSDLNINCVLSYQKKGDVCIRMRCWKKDVIILSRKKRKDPSA